MRARLPSTATEAQLSAATGLALANKREKNTAVVVAFTGKAVTALGAWHEALALSARRSLPMIFVVENNSRVKSAGPRSDWEDFTQKAQSYGLPGITVDGNDVVAVYRVAHESLERVRQGDGPVLIEARAYRQRPGAASPILSPTWKSTSRPKSSSILAGKIGWSKNFRENLTPPPKRREKCNPPQRNTRALA